MGLTINGREINNGVIRTDEHCRGCNKCIGSCPAPGANIALLHEGENHVYVDADRCIQCGTCLERCSHGSRQYLDDAARLLEDLESLRAGQRRRPISVVFDHGLVLGYPEAGPRALGWLKSLGVWHVYSSAFGAELAAWAYVQYITRTGRPGLIASACPSMVEAVEKHYPILIDQLIPVLSPAMCTAVYLRDQLKLETDVALISACPARKGEIERPQNRSYVQYNITLPRLMELYSEVELQKFEPAESELAYGPGALFPLAGGLREMLGLYMGDKAPFVLAASGPDRVFPLLEALTDDEDDPTAEEVALLEARGCLRGCAYGSATTYRSAPLGHIPLEVERLRRRLRAEGSPEERLAALEARFGGLNLRTYMASFYNRAQPVPLPDADELEEVFHRMYKFTKEDQTVDCSACGYASCRHMAQAILLGQNHLDNCCQYVRTRMGLEHAQAVASQQRLAQLESGTPTATVASLDQLTGLDIRAGFEQRLEEVLEAGGGGYIFGIDLDDFMAVNESYGHSAGNSLLVAVARYLRHEFGSLCQIFRIGGDEFALVAVGVDEHTAHYVESALLRKAREPWEAGELRVFCTLSIGVAPLTPDATVSSLVGHMEAALEAAKTGGKNTSVHYGPELDRQSGQQVQLLHQLRDDVLGGFQGFDVFFQPWVSCEGDLLGAEALARWRGADGRFVPPPEFIPVAESAGLISSIGDFVLRRAAEKCLEANMRLPNFTVSVNVSAKQFGRPDFFEHTMAILDDVGVDKSNIILEITESLGFDDIGRQREVLNRLHETGVQVAMDDFGTGYSSLSYLSELPLDLIKIDRTFVRELESDNYSKYLLTTMTDLMHKMGRKVVVEGIETRQQLDLCESFGVDIIQGFLFFRPMPGSQLTQLLSIS